MKKYKKIAVVGGGIFGCTTAWLLAKNGFEVALFERNKDILMAASHINQYRLHKGYHYPRSVETAIRSKNSEQLFLDVYGDSVYSDSPTDQYYGISKRDSIISALEYKHFLGKIGVDYQTVHTDILVNDSVSLIIKSSEYTFNPKILKSICNKNINDYGVNLYFNSEVKIQDLDDFDIVINATYANLNYLLSANKYKEYQFELCEKIVVDLPNKYQNKGAVIMDGHFMSIDPLKGTPYHVMGNVDYAIHESNIGAFPKYNPKFQGMLNNGMIIHPDITNFKKFLDSASEFFIDIEQAKHIGSMYTYRTVLPRREYDDARPTLVQKDNDRLYSVFSGKIGTCVEVANELLNKITLLNE